MRRHLAGLALTLTVAAFAAPAASACLTNADNNFLLYSAPPAALEPSEVVLEVDRKSIVGGVLGRYTRFDVKRVVSGDYKDPAVLVSYFSTECSFLSEKETDSYIIGTLNQRPNGPLVLSARVWRLGDVRKKALN